MSGCAMSIWGNDIMGDLLAIDRLTAGYKDATVIEDLSLAVAEGEVLAVLGRNGVGKTTLLASLMGLTTIGAGTVRLAGKDLSHMPPHERNRIGLGYVPQEREIFPSLTVHQNMQVALRRGPWDIDRVYALFPRLQERRANYGNQLSGGEQQMLAMGRALVGNPSLLLLDEPLEGLSPIIMDVLLDAVQALKQSGLTIILVEQHAHLALEVADNVIVLERGRIVHQSSAAALLADDARMGELLGLAEAEPR
jgi:branched-chain amino acid transport system ATP-binding protein